MYIGNINYDSQYNNYENYSEAINERGVKKTHDFLMINKCSTK